MFESDAYMFTLYCCIECSFKLLFKIVGLKLSGCERLLGPALINSFFLLVFQTLDVDECSIFPGICLHGNCVNTIGSFYCVCPQGYELIPELHACEGAFSCTYTAKL